jgi:hypothetical protein
MDHVGLTHPHDLRRTEIVTKFGIVYFKLRVIICLDCDLQLCWPTYRDVLLQQRSSSCASRSAFCHLGLTKS